jgi:hypothetical protein
MQREHLEAHESLPTYNTCIPNIILGQIWIVLIVLCRQRQRPRNRLNILAIIPSNLRAVYVCIVKSPQHYSSQCKGKIPSEKARYMQ